MRARERWPIVLADEEAHNVVIDALVKDSGASASARRERYGLLLVAILTAFGIQGIASPGPWEQVVVSALLAITCVLAAWASDARPKVMSGALVIGAAVVVASIVEAAAGIIDGPATRLANLVLVTLAPPMIAFGVVRVLRKRQRVTIEAVFGVLCLYILLGMFFAFVYGVIDRYDGPFFASEAPATVAHCLYYSYTTLTTVGYGDFTAASNLGHTLSSFEALIGQIYLVTVVSLIVGNLRRRSWEQS
jgi:hypothetical protein